MKNRWLRQGSKVGEWLASVGDESDNTTPGFVLHKFGRNPDIDSGTDEDIWDAGGDYNWPAAAQTMSVVSSDAADAAAGTGARTVQLIGLDSDYNYLTETVTLNGVTPVVTTGEFLRLHRMKVLTGGSGGLNAGDITATGSMSAAVHAQVSAGYNQTLMAIFTIPAGYTLFIESFVGSVLRSGGTARCDFEFRARQLGGVFQVKTLFTTASPDQSSFQYVFDSPFSVPEKTDIKFTGGSSANNSEIIAEINGYCLRNTYKGAFKGSNLIDG